MIIVIYEFYKGLYRKIPKSKNSNYDYCQQDVSHKKSPPEKPPECQILKHLCMALRSPRTSIVILPSRISSGVTERFILPFCLTAIILIS